MDFNKEEFEAQKKEIELSIIRTVLTQLEKQTITYDQSREIARYILLHIDEVNTSEQLLTFLQALALKWNIFESLKGLYRLKVGELVQTQEMLEETKDKLEEITGS